MCPWASRSGEARLLAFVAGRVRGPDGIRLRAHLEDCHRCSEYVAKQKAIWGILDEWEPEFTRPDFTSDVVVRVNNLPPENWFVQSGRFIMARMFRPACTVATISALLAISLYIRNPFVTSTQAPFAPRVVAAAPQGISPVEAEQMDRALDDLQLLHQLDALSDSSKDAPRSM